MKQVLNRLVALLISMSNFAKLSCQKRVNDRRKKNDGRNNVERVPLNPAHEFTKKRRNLLVMVAIYRQRKLYRWSQQSCGGGRMSSQTQRPSESKKQQCSTHGTQHFIETRSREPISTTAATDTRSEERR